MRLSDARRVRERPDAGGVRRLAHQGAPRRPPECWPARRSLPAEGRRRI